MNDPCLKKQSTNWALWLSLILSVIPLFAFQRGIVVGDTVTSRMATVYALVHDGVWHIDRPSDQPPNPFEQHTVDKVVAPDGRLLSSKPPVLPLLMTGEYLAMHKGFGWNLDAPEHLRPILQVMIFTLIKIPYLVGLLFFALLLKMFLPHDKRVILPLLALAWASPLPGYACQLNNHTPATAAVIVACYYGLGLYSGKLSTTRRRFVFFGIAAAAVFVLDMPATVFPACVGLLLFSRHPRQSLLWGGLGAAPLLLLHFGLMTYITGNPLPVQTQEAMYNFRNSYWRNPIGVDALNEHWHVYLFHMTFGRFGIFLLFPVLLLAGPGLIIGLRNASPAPRILLITLLGAFLIMTAYYVAKTNNYGGAAYGFRWYNAAVPPLLFAALPALPHIRGAARWSLVIILFIISLYSAWECMMAPWGASHEWTCRWIFGPVN